MSYGAVRPGFNTPVGQELFRICENWIGGVFGCVCLGVSSRVFVIIFIEIQKTNYFS